MTVDLEIPDQQAQLLQKAADRLGVPVEELATAAITDLIAQLAADFEGSATRVLRKNKELYGRLT